MELPKSFFESTYHVTRDNTCCDPNVIGQFNLYKANPFDQRPIKNQSNPWCSNELILKDAELRCKAKVQPLDVSVHQSLSNNIQPY